MLQSVGKDKMESLVKMFMVDGMVEEMPHGIIAQMRLLIKQVNAVEQVVVQHISLQVIGEL